MSRAGNFKKNKKVRTKERKQRKPYFGYPQEIVERQDEVKVGDKFVCKRCGQEHELVDASASFPGANIGDILMYRCFDRFIMGGLYGHSVLNIDNNVLPHKFRIADCLTDFVDHIAPFAVMATQQERLIKDKGVLLKGDEFVRVRVPFSVLRLLRYTVKNTMQILLEDGYLNMTQEKIDTMFDPSFINTVLLDVTIPPLERPSSLQVDLPRK